MQANSVFFSAPPLSSPLVNGLTLLRLPAVFTLSELGKHLDNVGLTLWTRNVEAGRAGTAQIPFLSPGATIPEPLEPWR